MPRQNPAVRRHGAAVWRVASPTVVVSIGADSHRQHRSLGSQASTSGVQSAYECCENSTANEQQLPSTLGSLQCRAARRSALGSPAISALQRRTWLRFPPSGLATVSYHQHSSHQAVATTGRLYLDCQRRCDESAQTSQLSRLVDGSRSRVPRCLEPNWWSFGSRPATR